MDVGELQTILSLDWKYGLIFVAAVIILAVWIIQKFDFLVGRFGFETAKMRKEKQQDKDIADLKSHVERSEPKIDKLFGSVDEMKECMKELSNQMKDMQKKMDESDRSKLGDRLTQMYNKYRKKKQWTEMDKWAFDNMVQSYKAVGGDSWIDEVVVPASRNWEIIDE